jgi:hypothetical protein
MSVVCRAEGIVCFMVADGADGKLTVFLVVSAGMVDVLTFSLAPAIRAANAGFPTQSIIISAMIPHEKKHGFKIKECEVLILILFFLQ